MVLLVFLLSTCGSLLVAWRLIRHPSWLARYSMDSVVAGPQKFHHVPTPRIGGIAVMAGLLVALAIMGYFHMPGATVLLALLLSGLPVFLAGLTEDLFKNVRPLFRLLASFVSAGVAMSLLDTSLRDIDIPLLNQLLVAFPLLSVLLTLFAVGGVSHALNIIDGYNGLMAGYAIMVAAALGFVSYQVEDRALLAGCLALGGALTGFWLMNFPRGRIFAGDAGAYFVGFLLAEVSILLVNRHEEVVSPWFPMMLMMYPVVETLFSIYRKLLLRRMSPGLPDGLHLHMLVYKRLVRWRVGSREGGDRVARNSLTSLYLWGLSQLSILPAVVFWPHIPVLKGGCLVFAMAYLWFYWSLIRFRSPRWLRLHVPHPSSPSRSSL